MHLHLLYPFLIPFSLSSNLHNFITRIWNYLQACITTKPSTYRNGMYHKLVYRSRINRENSLDFMITLSIFFIQSFAVTKGFAGIYETENWSMSFHILHHDFFIFQTLLQRSTEQISWNVLNAFKNMLFMRDKNVIFNWKI